MPDDSNALQRNAERLAREADAISARFARELAKVFRTADRRIREWLGSNSKPTAAVKREIRQALRTSGFDALAEAATRAPFDTIASRVIRGRTVDVGQLELWRLWHLEDLRDEGAIVSRSIGGALMRGSLGRKATRAIPQEIGKILEHAEARVQTLYDTAVSIYGRQVEAESAGDEATTRFTYMGPVDQKTRDFCLRHVGKVYTRGEIDQLDNEQLSNVFLTGGGYNCRHVWMEVSKYSELYELQGTDERAPEIDDAVQEVRQAA
jgi:hypothetical protein